jgi:heme-degrading monooxygenase HmoA
MIILLFSFTGFLDYFKIGMPYKVLKPGYSKDSNVVLAITYIEIKKDSPDLSKFWDHVFGIHKNMGENPGVLGVSIRKTIFSSKAWTMTIWENESSLENFVENERHRTAMREGRSAIVKTKFYRTTKKYSELPISWDVAEALVEKEGVEY